MVNALGAVARETWIGVREARGRIASADGDNVVPASGDFDSEMEVWYR